jgi:HSP20 family protein
MSGIIRKSALPARTLSKREFLTPFDELFNSMMGDMFPTFHRDLGNNFFADGSYPKCNVVNFDDRIEIEAAIPGLSKDDVTVEIAEGVLTIKAESNQRTDVEDSQYVKREVKRSAFARSFRLGENLDDSGVVGTHENGILVVTIPKVQPTNTEPVIRTIEIK